MSDLYNATPLTGRWLVDTQSKFSNYCFRITDEYTYIRDLDLYYDARIQCDASRFRCQIDDHCNPRGPYELDYVQDDNLFQLKRLFQIVSDVRDEVALFDPPSPDVVLSYDALPLVSKELLPPPALKKRKFFLMVARFIVFDNLSIERAASLFNVNIESVRIWLTAFLTHGPAYFFYKPKSLTFEEEEKIVDQHFKKRSSLVYSCARYMILDRNRFRRMLHRHRNKISPQAG